MNDITIDNPSAFPIPSDGGCVGSDGMTLLDYFAAKTMQAHVTNTVYMNSIAETHKTIKKAVGSVCKDSYMVAKAMLKERQKHL